MIRPKIVQLSLILFLIILGGFSCRHIPSSSQSAALKEKKVVVKSLPRWIEESSRKCASDDDCVLVPADCCGCRQGGLQTAIHRQFLKQTQLERAYACSETLCVQMLSEDSTCKAKSAKCIDGICALSI